MFHISPVWMQRLFKQTCSHSWGIPRYIVLCPDLSSSLLGKPEALSQCWLNVASKPALGSIFRVLLGMMAQHWSTKS